MTAPPEPQTETAPASSAPPAEKKKPKRQKARFVGIRFDDAGFDEAQRRARAVGLSLGAYARRQMIDDAGNRARRAPPTPDSQLKAGHLAALNRVGNLLNQGIRALNTIALETPEAVSRDRIADEIAQARELLEAAIPSLLETLAANREALGDVREG